MTLVSIKEDLIKARAGHYAIPLLDVFEQQGVEGTLEALIQKRAPTIMGVYSPFASAANGRAFAAYIRARAQDTDVPIALMLDHGASVDECLQMLEYGYTDVMYDGSKLPLEENIANTRKVVEAAHAVGVGVEAELGHVGQADVYESFAAQRVGFTDPDVVEMFVHETGVDFLAIAFGNAHGLYKAAPRLDMELVAEVRRRVSVPLVMHGGTGTSDAQFREAVAAGICKVNYATNITNSAVKNMQATAQRAGVSMFDISQGIRDAYVEWGTHLFDVFGTSGKG